MGEAHFAPRNAALSVPDAAPQLPKAGWGGVRDDSVHPGRGRKRHASAVSAVPLERRRQPADGASRLPGVSVSFSVLAEREPLCSKGGIDPAAFFVFYRLIKGTLKRAPLAAHSSRGRSPRPAGRGRRRRRRVFSACPLLAGQGAGRKFNFRLYYPN
ncbi:MAG: hypothetical protein MPK62_07900 [Alphaproteobacteria bacterium]|nr:hypothetical protein [Alphaproteobacteria bacterium]